MRVLILLLSFLLLSLLPCSLMARTWHVPSEAPTIQAGIDSAAVGDTVEVACGNYYEHDIVMKSGVCLRGEAGEADCVIIDAQQQGRVFYCEGLEEGTTFEGLTISGGRVTGETWGGSGGGMYCARSSPVFINCAFTENTTNGAYSGGGGAFCLECSLLTLIGCTFSGNHAGPWETDGGGLECISSSAELSECTFTGNSATSGGGGIASIASSFALANCTFVSNTSEFGGGMASWYWSEAVLTGCVFRGNTSPHGGGVQLASSSVLNDCIFLDNFSACCGGGAGLRGSCTVARCVFIGNSADGWGGGLWWDAEAAEAPALTGCVFSHNWAGGSGGGIFAERSATVSNCTLVGNSSERGGGLYATAACDYTVSNSVIAFSLQGGAVYCDPGGSATLGCCDVYGNAGGDWEGCLDGQHRVNGNIWVDPHFCDPENDDYSLAENSPCAPGQQPDCGLIGALGVGCGPTAAVPTTWGLVKSVFELPRER